MRRWVSSVGWGGGEGPVGLAVQPPAALMHRMMMPAAHQHQVPQIGGAAVEPVAQVVGVAPGHRPVTPREPATTVAHRQRGPLRGGDHPGGAAHLQRLRWGTTKDRWQQGHRGMESGCQPGGRVVVAGFRGGSPSPQCSDAGCWPASQPGWPSPPSRSGWWWRSRVTSTRVTVASQASRRAVSAGSGPTQPPSAPGSPGSPSRLASSIVTVTWGRTPPVCGSRPLPGPGGPVRSAHPRAAARHCARRRRCWGGPAVLRRFARSGDIRGSNPVGCLDARRCCAWQFWYGSLAAFTAVR